MFQLSESNGVSCGPFTDFEWAETKRRSISGIVTNELITRSFILTKMSFALLASVSLAACSYSVLKSLLIHLTRLTPCQPFDFWVTSRATSPEYHAFM